MINFTLHFYFFLKIIIIITFVSCQLQWETKTLKGIKAAAGRQNTKSNSLKLPTRCACSEVSASLYQRALGYSHDDVDIKVVRGKIVKTKIRKHYPPDTTAAIFWLKNRQKHNWRDKQEHGFTDLDGKDILLGYGKEEDDD